MREILKRSMTGSDPISLRFMSIFFEIEKIEATVKNRRFCLQEA